MNPWPWYVGGALVAFVMIALIWLGKTFGFSSNFRTMCAALGAGKSCDFFFALTGVHNNGIFFFSWAL